MLGPPVLFGGAGLPRFGSPPALEVVTAINSMQDNEYRVVRTQFGWHVLQRLPAPTLAEVEPEIRDNLALVAQANAGQEWLT